MQVSVSRPFLFSLFINASSLIFRYGFPYQLYDITSRNVDFPAPFLPLIAVSPGSKVWVISFAPYDKTFLNFRYSSSMYINSPEIFIWVWMAVYKKIVDRRVIWKFYRFNFICSFKKFICTVNHFFLVDFTYNTPRYSI